MIRTKIGRVSLGAGLFLALMGACAQQGASTRAPTTIKVRSASKTLTYTVEVAEGMESLEIEAQFPKGTPTEWAVERPAIPYVTDLKIVPVGSAVEFDWSDTGEEKCRLHGCQVSYSFALDRAAREIGSRMVADRYGESIIAPSSTWLVRPRNPAPDSRQRYEVITPKGLGFGTGTNPARGSKNTYESRLPQGFHAPYAAFGPMRSKKVSVGKRDLSVFLLSSEKQPLEREYLGWVEESGLAIGRYFGQFPAEHTAVFLLPFDYHGSQMGIGGASVILGMNSAKLPEDSGRLWVAAHEMVHVGFPGTDRRHRWATEGLATYVETVARAQAGLINREELWDVFIRRLPEGQPDSRDRGLDVTHTWARTYWGGALFFFQADVEIARATNGKKSLREALRGLNAAGGNSSQYWPLQEIFSVMDDSLGVEVLIPLYKLHARQAVPVRLGPIFDSMGIIRKGTTLTFNDNADEAHVRKIIEGTN